MTGDFWPGLDQEFMRQVGEAASSSKGEEFERTLGESWIFSDGKLLPLAIPLQSGTERHSAPTMGAWTESPDSDWPWRRFRSWRRR